MISNQLSHYLTKCTNEVEQACSQGDLVALKYLIEEKEISLFTINPFTGASLLHFAAQSGSIEVFSYLLEKGLYLNQQVPINGMTPLMVAVWHKHVELTVFLLQQASINIEIRSHYGLLTKDLSCFGFKQPYDQQAEAIISEFDSLFEAYIASRNSIEKQGLFSILFNDESDSEKASAIEAGISFGKISAHEINTVLPHKCDGNDAHTPLLLASRDGLTETVKVLLKHGADQTIVDGYMRSLPIHKAAFSGHEGVLRELLLDSKSQQTINAQGPFNGYTPLHDAVWNGHDESVELLIKHNCASDIQGHDGHTPIDFAVRLRRESMLQIL